MISIRNFHLTVCFSTLTLACGGDGSPTGQGDQEQSSPDGGTDELVPLPPEVREHDGVLNLVDATAAAELDAFLQNPGRLSSLSGPTNRFLQYYEEEYDFLFFFTDHDVATNTVGKFEPVNKVAGPGDGEVADIAAPDFRSNGRLKGAIGINKAGPLAHEILHYWANNLDPRFGFDRGRDEGFGGHWGYASVHGQLGGFDGSTLRCLDPADAVPPGCLAVAEGRFQVRVGSFAPHANGAIPYAPLELYLMGLAPRSEVSEPIVVLDEAVEVGTYDGDILLEVSGMHEVSIADIIAVHGEKPLLPDDQREFRAAFILVSAKPANDTDMNWLAENARTFANEKPELLYTFENLTGGRATITTHLRSRRRVSSVLPEPRAPFKCDPLGQDCENPLAACYVTARVMCALPGSAEDGEPCTASISCARGLDCIGPNDAPDQRVCRHFCDPREEASPEACATLCPGSAATFVDRDGAPLGTICVDGPSATALSGP
jgi:hypothetical protein